ncbi:MAG: diaminopimelate epimerase [Candidatus Kapabacteria bacterium]|nr:diaminopimelate epimerase [Candidatus Kapabacteria bacterium]
MSGAGNLFTVIDNSGGLVTPQQIQPHVPSLCSDATLPKTEGLMMLQESQELDLDFRVDFFNPDGSTSMMCGNGARCAIRFAQHIGIIKADDSYVRFFMAGNVYSGISSLDDITVVFPPPQSIQRHLPLLIDNYSITVSSINTGSDHIVLHEDELSTAATKLFMSELEVMSLLRNHPVFPRGTNVNVYSQTDTILHLRTYERGVEGITGACGTGALATAIHCWDGIDTAIHYTIIPPSQSTLSVRIESLDGIIQYMTLEGSADILTTYSVEIPLT